MRHNQSFSLITLFSDQTGRRLAILISLSLVGYIIFATWFPIQTNVHSVPLLDIRSFTPSLLQGALYGLLVMALFGLFLLIVRLLSALKFELSPLFILLVSTLFSLPLLMVYPINANDIYRYLIRGRITSIYGQNPFATAPSAYPEDPFLPLAGEWAGETSPYGPLWEALAAGITYFTKDELLIGLLAFKLLILLAFLASTVVLWKLFGLSQNLSGGISLPSDMGLREKLTVLWAWNPALLFIFMIHGHNDIVMFFWLLVGYYVIVRGFPLAGFLLMVLGALSKPIGVLVLPIMFFALLHEKRSWLERLRFSFLACAGSLLLIVLFFLPFGSALDLLQRLLREAGGGGAFSPGIIGLLMVQASGYPLTGEMITFWTQFLLALFVVFSIWLLWRTWHGRSSLRGMADIFLAYIVQALNFRIWYASWPFPWFLLDKARSVHSQSADYRLYFGFWFLLTSQLSVLIYGHLRIYLLDGSQIAAHFLGVPFTFLLPILLAWFSVKIGLFAPRRKDEKSQFS